MFEEITTPQEAAANIESGTPQARIAAEMNRRRIIMDAQVRAAAIQSELCDYIREIKWKTPELEPKIAELAEVDPGLYNYIRKLERINSGIWCTACSNIAQVSGGAAALLM